MFTAKENTNHYMTVSVFSFLVQSFLFILTI